MVGYGTSLVLQARQSKNDCIEIPKIVVYSSIDKPYHLSHYLIGLLNFSFKISKSNPSNFTVTLPFNREIHYACIHWHSFICILLIYIYIYIYIYITFEEAGLYAFRFTIITLENYSTKPSFLFFIYLYVLRLYTQSLITNCL